MKSHWLKSVLGGTVVLGTTVAGAGADTDAQRLAGELAALRQRVESQQVEIERLRDERGRSWLDQRRAEEIKALVEETLADADTRASLAGSGATAGYDKGFFLRSGDGNFLLKIGGQVPFRYIYDHRDRPGTTTTRTATYGASTGDPVTTTVTVTLNDADQAGFTARRTKLWFTGHVGDPRINYKVVLNADRSTAALGVEEAWVAYGANDQLTLIAGRLKAPATRETLISSAKNLAVEPSYVDSQLGGGYAEGLAAVYATESVKVTAAFSDGGGSGNLTNATKDFNAADVDYALTLRVDAKLQGDWSQWEDLSSWSSEKTGAIFLGAAVHYQGAETGTTAANNEFLLWTVDASWKTSGLNLYAAVIGNHLYQEVGGQTNAYGYVVQGGHFVIPDQLEPFARYEYFDPSAGANLSLVTVGVNYYLAKQSAKLTGDVIWALDPVATGSSGIGVQADAGADQFVVRLGLSLVF